MKAMSTPLGFQLTVGILVFLTMACVTYAQVEPTPPHAATTIPASARYEIVQSELAAKWMFRLDRVCGQVAQLAETKSGYNTWVNMPILNLPRCVLGRGTQYQIFSSGLDAEFTFLMNLNTGTTWQLVRVHDEKLGDYPAWTLLAK